MSTEDVRSVRLVDRVDEDIGDQCVAGVSTDATVKLDIPYKYPSVQHTPGLIEEASLKYGSDGFALARPWKIA